jgi:6-pyruvoyltetrahydropterin/6-carboxytetrahydropterin synthase
MVVVPISSKWYCIMERGIAMYEIGVVSQFEAAHRLVGDFGPAQRMHGHTYRVEVSVQGATLANDGTLVDISLIQARLGDVVGRLHYQNLDEVPGLIGRNTTAEVVADFIWDELASVLHQRGLTQLRVAVWESPQAWAAITKELAP